MYISSKSLLQILTVDAIITESIGYTHHCICHVVKQDIGPWLWVQQKSHITEISQLYNILCTTLCTLEVSDINLCSPSFEARLSDAFLFFDHAPYLIENVGSHQINDAGPLQNLISPSQQISYPY